MLTRKQKSAQKRAEKVNELMAYFLQVFEAIVVQQPKEAIATAIDRTEKMLNGWVSKSPQEKSFYVDVLIEFRERLDQEAAKRGWIRKARTA